MKFEHVLAETDGFGRFQIMIVCLVFVARLTLPCQFLVHNFIAAVTDHRCDIDGLDDGEVFVNLTQDQRLTVSIPAEKDGSLSSCKMFREPQFHLLYNSSNTTEIPAVSCQYGWVYDTSTFSSTLATEWDLVCDKRSLNKATATIFFVGVMIGAVVFGSLSDRFGIALTYYGISFNITGFGMNIYLTQCVYAAIEVPAKLSVYYLLDKIGRRSVEVGSLLGAGLCLAINIFVPKANPTIRLYIPLASGPSLRYVVVSLCRRYPWKRLFSSLLHHSVPVHVRALPYRCQTKWHGLHFLHGSGGRVHCSTHNIIG
ncbi:hypothetical protein SKAU_G00180950 [Synaphobranchus kaupii]|uniref:Uncharacterized protein n=1 Tax=Synaphobranchus kaupii TaxID=118154 RepID=A0A9Q1FMB6_SYNKA|nr:hypothetical protein SKAU_G00180950 [Synaphobranchus kaupii]